MFMHSSLVVYGRTTFYILHNSCDFWVNDQIGLGDFILLSLADSLLYIPANALQLAVVIYLLYGVKQ